METPILKTAGLITAEELKILDKLKNSNRIRDYFSKGKRKQQILDNEQLIGLQGELKIEDLEEIVLKLYPNEDLTVSQPLNRFPVNVKSNSAGKIPKNEEAVIDFTDPKAGTGQGAQIEVRQQYIEAGQTKNKTVKAFTENSIAKLSDSTGIKLSKLRESLAINHYYEKLAEEGNQKDDFLLAI